MRRMTKLGAELLRRPVVVTGMGIISSIGQNVLEFEQSLRQGKTGIRSFTGPSEGIRFSAPILDFDHLRVLEGVPQELFLRAKKILRNTSLSCRITTSAAIEAFNMSKLSLYDSHRAGVVLGGNNVNQGFVYKSHNDYLKVPEFLNPLYALCFMDTDLIGRLTEVLGFKGWSQTVGAASASGNVAIAQGLELIRSGRLDVCLVAGAMADLSELEITGFSRLGALYSDSDPSAKAEAACRPFDRAHKGFIYGQGSGCLLLESLEHARRRDAEILAEVRGAAVCMDANHYANPNPEGEARSMRLALEDAKVSTTDVNYINAHGTSSPIGDDSEAKAIRETFLDQCRQIKINSTKSLTGHCLFSAGVIEAVATIIQMRGDFLHPNLNLNDPIDSELKFVGGILEEQRTNLAISNSFGFGGFNSTTVFSK